MNVTIHYLFSRNKKIGSKLISWGTSFIEPSIKEVPSHGAVLINNKWVIESTLESGMRVIGYNKWKEINEEIAKMECIKQRTMNEIKSLYRPLKDKGYDYMGILYFTYRVILLILFKKSIPKINKLNVKDKYFCTEVLGILRGVSNEMMAPVTLMKNIHINN